MTFDELGIDVMGRTGNIKVPCPECSHTRKKPKEPCLSVNVEDGVYHCHNCGWKGKAFPPRLFEPSRRVKKVYKRPEVPNPTTDQAALVTWFQHRGIEPWVLEHFRIRLVKKFLPGVNEEVPCIYFPYYRNLELVNAKYRGLEVKSFCQEKDAEKVFFSIVPLPLEEIIICEGEIDTLSFHQAGLNAISVPDGALPEGATGSDQKFEYLVNCAADLTSTTKIILATDNDGPGRGLAAELARRLGEHRCWRVEWPSSCKDANDVLVGYGKEGLHSLIDGARPWPIQGIIEPLDVVDEILALRHNPKKIGVSTGWKTLDPYYKILMPEVTIIGGTPNHGKSNFINNLAMNLVKLYQYPVAMACFEEGKPPEHFSRITSKYQGKSYWPSRHGVMQTEGEVLDAIQFMQGHFFLIRLEFEERTLEKILTIAGEAVRRHGVRCLFIDPWNNLNHVRPPGMTETEEVSHAMSQLRDFAEQTETHVFLCAHPAKPIMAKVDGELAQQIPHPYHTSGSAHWYNKTDNFLTIFRDVSKGEDEEKRVGVYVQKVRTQRVGQIGMVELRFDPASECLRDLGNLERGTRS